MTELQLLRRIAQHDEAALKQLYGLYYQRLARFLLRITRDPELTAEVINDVFLVVWRSADRFRGDSSPSTWIMGIAHKKALKAFRSRKPTVSLETVTETAAETNDKFNDRVNDVYASVDKLTPNHKAVIVLTYQFGYSYKEIGEILHCPENTVKTRMFHARRALQGLLEANE